MYSSSCLSTPHTFSQPKSPFATNESVDRGRSRYSIDMYCYCYPTKPFRERLVLSVSKVFVELILSNLCSFKPEQRYARKARNKIARSSRDLTIRSRLFLSYLFSFLKLRRYEIDGAVNTFATASTYTMEITPCRIQFYCFLFFFCF